MSNITNTIRNNQSKFICELFTEMDPIKMHNRVKLYLSRQGKAHINIFRFILYQGQEYISLFYSHHNIAEKNDLSVSTVKRVMNELNELELIKKIYRHHKSCLYIINPALNERWVRYEISRLIPTLSPARFLAIRYVNPEKNDFVEIQKRKVDKYKDKMKRGKRPDSPITMRSKGWFLELLYIMQTAGLTHFIFRKYYINHIFHADTGEICDFSCVNRLFDKSKRV